LSSATLATVLALAAEGGRLCPKPAAWAKLYALLPDTRRDAYGAIPAEPLILGSWSESSDEQKAFRLREHLEWADAHGGLARVHAFLASLPERDWHHVGE
jgi:hypothetical protein